MNLTRVGLITAVTTITIGTALWHTRTDGRIQAQDMAELMNAVQERCLATRFSTNGIYDKGTYYIAATQPAISTNAGFSIVACSNDLHTFFHGTNPAPYALPLLTPTAPYTNWTQIGGPDGAIWESISNGVITFYEGTPAISFNARAFVRSYREEDPTNRWILGTFESFEVSGFEESDFNGTYQRHYDALFVDGEWVTSGTTYSNANGCALSPDENESTFTRGSVITGSRYAMDGPPWAGGTVRDNSTYSHDPQYADFQITCTRGPLATNTLIRTEAGASITNVIPEPILDRPCYVNVYTYDWILGNRRPSWTELLGTIDRFLFGEYHFNEYDIGPLNSDIGGWFTGIAYSPWLRPMLTQSVVSVYTGPFYDHAFFVDPTKWGTASFTNVATLELDIPGWGLTNTAAFTDGTHTVTMTGFDDALLYPASNQRADFIMASNAWQITKHALDQRRAALQQCTVLRMHGQRAQWTAYPSNLVWSGAISSTNSYSEACSLATAACTNYTQEAGAPYAYAHASFATFPVDTWIVSMKARSARIWMAIDTNTACEASTYLRGRMKDAAYGYWAETNNRSFGDFTGYMASNLFTLANTTDQAYRSVYTNLLVTNNMAIYPPEPTVVGNDGRKLVSYTLEDATDVEIITRWAFQHCAP